MTEISASREEASIVLDALNDWIEKFSEMEQTGEIAEFGRTADDVRVAEKLYTRIFRCAHEMRRL